MGTGSLLGVKRPECEVKHSPPSSAEVKSKWSRITTTHIGLHFVGREIFIVVKFSVKI